MEQPCHALQVSLPWSPTSNPNGGNCPVCLGRIKWDDLEPKSCPKCPKWFCWSLSLLFMAIIGGIPHFQTNPSHTKSILIKFSLIWLILIDLAWFLVDSGAFESAKEKFTNAQGRTRITSEGAILLSHGITGDSNSQRMRHLQQATPHWCSQKCSDLKNSSDFYLQT